MTDTDDHRRWRAVLSGEAGLTWDLWGASIDASSVLTADGKRAVRHAVDTVAEFFGPTWLADFAPHPARDGAAARTGLPFMSLRWWPANDVPHVHQRLLLLGTRLQAITGTPGLAQVRRDLRRDVGHFAHGLMQIEVASLAVRTGHAVTLEPKPDASGSRRADLLVRGSTGPLLVETKMFNLNDVVRNDLAATDIVMNLVRQLEWKHGVQVTGELHAVDDADGVTLWLQELAGLAECVSRTGIVVDLDQPFGRLRITPGSGMLPGAELTVPIRSRDEWPRLTDQIAKKADQGRGDAPLWLRFDQTPQFWSLSTPPGVPQREWLDSIAHGLEAQVDQYPHVAGIVLSAPPHAVAASAEVEVGSRSVVLGRAVGPLDWRETLVVPARSAGGTEPWSSWYASEPDWLAWALERLDVPPLGNLFLDGAR